MSPPTAPGPVASEIDYLDEDVVTVPGQTYALVSFVTPTGPRQKSDKFAMKIRGSFGTKAEAEAHVKKLMRIDPSFDIFLVETGRWLAVPPDPNSIEEQEYSQQFLNDLMKGYKESQLAAKQHFAERKRMVMEQGLDATLTPEERISPPAGDGASTSDVAADVFGAADTHPSSSKAPVTAPSAP